MTKKSKINHIKEEPIAPPFLHQDTILAVFVAIYAGGGFGHKFVTEASFVITALAILIKSKRLGIVTIGAIVGMCLYEPALIQSPPLLGCILFFGNKPKLAVLALMGSVLQLIGGFNPFYIPFILIPFVLLASWTWIPDIKLIKICTVILLSALITPTLIPQKLPIGHQKFAYPYRIEIAKRHGNRKATSTYTSIDDNGNYNTAKVLVLEHDPLHGLATHNWSQKRLWSENQYFGAPLFRIAVGLDGYLYSNLGCRIDNSTIRLLGEGYGSEHNSIISKRTGQLIFSDSDMLNNAAVGYQKNLVSALFDRFSIAHGILLTSCVCLILAFWSSTKTFSLPILAISLLAACIAINLQTVDIRICDNKPLWPHAKGIGGIGCEITELTGIKTVSRRGRAQILGIARNASGSHSAEKVIVMEGASSVKIGETIYEALDLPMGISEGVIDAIPIRKVGSETLGKCRQKIGDLTIIGTNSARLNSNIIYDATK